LNAKQLFEEVNRSAAETELSKMTMQDIDAKVKAHRSGQ
jgi:hypothetical protein